METGYLDVQNVGRSWPSDEPNYDGFAYEAKRCDVEHWSLHEAKRCDVEPYPL